MVLHSKNGYPEFCPKTSRITYLTFLLSKKNQAKLQSPRTRNKTYSSNLWKSIRVFPALWRIICKLYPFIRTLAVKKGSDQSRTYRPIKKSADFDKESSYFFFHYFSIKNCLALRQRKNLSSSLWMKFGLQSGNATCCNRATKSRRIFNQIF